MRTTPQIKILLVALILIQAAYSTSINFDVYHTSDEINDEIKKLENNCEGYSVNLANDNPDIYEITLASTNPDSKSLKGLIIFGEHPREMISPETGLNFLKSLCGKSPYGEYEWTQEIREKYTLKLVLNSNPGSRRKVEEGEYCKRENPNFVDINRNWGSHWEYVNNESQQLNSGTAPFSEVETKTLKRIAHDFLPNVFISIHSGTLGLYTPYAYTDTRAERNEDHMMDIVTNIQNKYCRDCGVGAAGKEVGYLCPGTCLDYIYESLNADYSFAFEIYSNNYNIRESLSQTNLLSIRSRSLRGRTHKKEINHYARPPSCFLQTSSETEIKRLDSDSTLFQDDYNQCFLFFNPESHDDYDYVVDNWTKALYETLDQVTENKSL